MRFSAMLCFSARLFSIVCLAALSGGGMSDLVVLYGFSAIVSTIILGITKHPYAAYYCGAVPLVVLLYFLFYGFPANLAPIDHFVLIAFTLDLAALLVADREYRKGVSGHARRTASLMPKPEPGAF